MSQIRQKKFADLLEIETALLKIEIVSGVFWQSSLDFQQVGLDFGQGGFDFQQVGKS